MRSAVFIIFVNLWSKSTSPNLDCLASYKFINKRFLFKYLLTKHDETSKHQHGVIWKRMVLADVMDSHMIRQPLTPNKTVQTCQSKTFYNELILNLLRQFLRPSLPWHTDITQYQGNLRQIQHMLCILYSKKWGIGWWSNKIIKYHVTKKASISTLTGIIYTGMYNYGNANS